MHSRLSENIEVLQYILARKKAGNNNDGHKIGVIFEGGGLRAVFSSGAACGLEELGLRDCFDVVYGSSAGSCVAAYFVSGEIEKGTRIFYEDLNAFKFIKPWRVMSMLDIGHLENSFRTGSKALNRKAITDSKTLLRVFASDFDTGESICFTNRDEVDIISALVASGSAVGYCNKPIEVGGRVCLDGNLAKKLPIEEAISDGCTDILIIPTVPENYRENTRQVLNAIKPLFMAGLTKQYRRAYRKRDGIYNNNLDIAFGRKKLDNGIRLYTISPDFRTSVAEIRAVRSKYVGECGRGKVLEAFEGAKEK